MSNTSPVRPLVSRFINSLVFDVALTPAMYVDFGIDNPDQHRAWRDAIEGALQSLDMDAVEQAVDRVLGNGPKITAFVHTYAPHYRQIRFGPAPLVQDNASIESMQTIVSLAVAGRDDNKTVLFDGGNPYADAWQYLIDGYAQRFGVALTGDIKVDGEAVQAAMWETGGIRSHIEEHVLPATPVDPQVIAPGQTLKVFLSDEDDCIATPRLPVNIRVSAHIIDVSIPDQAGGEAASAWLVYNEHQLVLKAAGCEATRESETDVDCVLVSQNDIVELGTLARPSTLPRQALDLSRPSMRTLWLLTTVVRPADGSGITGTYPFFGRDGEQRAQQQLVDLFAQHVDYTPTGSLHTDYQSVMDRVRTSQTLAARITEHPVPVRNPVQEFIENIDFEREQPGLQEEIQGSTDFLALALTSTGYRFGITEHAAAALLIDSLQRRYDLA